jgi:hypothetical protein
MLPHFPKAYKEMRDLFYSQVFDAMHVAAPMLLQIPIRPQREGREGSFKMKVAECASLTSSVRPRQFRSKRRREAGSRGQI